MTHYVTGNTIKALREKKKYTQKQLADRLAVSDKTVSKWETQKGLAGHRLLEPLAKSWGYRWQSCSLASASPTGTGRATCCGQSFTSARSAAM